MKKMKKSMIALLVFCLMMSCMMIHAFAAGKIETEKNCKLVVTYHYGEEELSDFNVKLYRVADISEYAQLTLTDDFKTYPVDVENAAEKDWDLIATTLEGYIYQNEAMGNGPEVIAHGKTNSEGKIEFPNTEASLTPGLYMIIGERYVNNGYRYVSDPAIVCLPKADEQENIWIYELDVYPKLSRKPIGDGDTPKSVKVSRKVLKIWKDNGNEEARPESISVNLLKNGEVVETVILGDENNWTYTWTELDKDADWNVTEEVPSGYHVTITKEGNTFIVKNHVNPYGEDPGRDDPPSDPGHGVLGAFDELPFGLLPQTGTTWWISVILAGLGIMSIAAGLLLGRKEQ